VTETTLAGGEVEPYLSKSYLAVPASCGSARADIAAFLSATGVDTEAVDVALLAASELVTNGLIHHEVRDGERFCVNVRVTSGPGGAWILLTVVDGGAGRLRTTTRFDDGDECGRGLILLRGLGVVVSDAPVVRGRGYEVTARYPADGVARKRVCGCGCTISMPGALAHCLLLVSDPQDSAVLSNVDEVLSRPVCDPCRSHTPLRAGSHTSNDHGSTYANAVA
jgi:anti-sigma regulatory factor (Ser/Thr protein kinase)